MIRARISPAAGADRPHPAVWGLAGILVGNLLVVALDAAIGGPGAFALFGL